MTESFDYMNEKFVTIVNTRPFDVLLLVDKNGFKEDYLVKRENMVVTRGYYACTEPPQVVVENEHKTFNLPICRIVYDNNARQILKMPDEQPGIFYIVSDLVAVAAARIGRNDCLFPGGEVRDIDAPAEILGYYWLYKG